MRFLNFWIQTWFQSCAPEISAKFGIRNIPTILFLKNGEVVDKQVGAVQKSALAEKLDKLL